MTEAQITAPSVERAEAREHLQLIRLAVTAGTTSVSAARVVLFLALASLVAAAALWFICFSSYVLDSFKAALACFAVLGVMAAPGLFLFELYRALRNFACLPERLSTASLQLLETEPVESRAPQSTVATNGEDADRQWHEKVWSRLRELFDLWDSVIDARQALSRLAGSVSLVAFLTHPATPIVAAVSIAVSALLAVAATLAFLWTVVASLL